jgi:hypothetical protein
MWVEFWIRIYKNIGPSMEAWGTNPIAKGLQMIGPGSERDLIFLCIFRIIDLFGEKSPILRGPF